MSDNKPDSTEHVFGEQYAVCEIDDGDGECGYTVRSMHSAVLLMKLDNHLQDEHNTTVEEQAEQCLDIDSENQLEQ